MCERVYEEVSANEFAKFFEKKISLPEKVVCKIYNDGGHYVGVPYFENKRKHVVRVTCENDVQRELFESCYAKAICDGLSKEETISFLKDNLYHMFADDCSLNDFIDGELKRKARNFIARKKRFRRKAYLNRWNYFITITYSDEKHTEDEFRLKLRKCLCNLHTRRKWRYMGVFERAPETGRLHFHAILYVPDGEMIGCINEKNDYSTKTHKMQKTCENDFFAKKFGRNDFSILSEKELKNGDTIAYLLKYIQKTGEKITYSRGVPSTICKEIESEDIACEMRDFVLKYVLFDDVVTWENDVMHFVPKQISFADITPKYLC